MIEAIIFGIAIFISILTIFEFIDIEIKYIVTKEPICWNYLIISILVTSIF